LECDPLNASVTLVLANAYQKIEAFEEARTFYQLAIELDWEDEEILRDFMLFMAEYNPLEAIDFLESFQMELDNNPEYLLLFTHVLIKLNRFQEALLLFSSLVAVQRPKAQLIMEWNPFLQNHKDFVTLLHE